MSPHRRMSGTQIQHGFGLVEFMTSAALTLILLGGVFAMFAGSRASYSKGQQLGEIQESGRYALERVVHDVRMAGFPGCSSAALVRGSTWYQEELEWNFMTDSIRGFDSDSTASWPRDLVASIAPQSLAGSDILVVQVPVGLPLEIQNSMDDNGGPVVVSEDAVSRLSSGDVVLASDCRARSYFVVTSINGDKLSYDAFVDANNPEQRAQSLQHAFPAGSELTTVQTNVYFVRQGNGVPALWRRSGLHLPEEIAPGVESMQLQFGVDDNGDETIDAYRSAASVDRWENVRSVLVELTVRAGDSERANEPVGEAGHDDPNERQGIVQVFTTAVSLRNARSVR